MNFIERFFGLSPDGGTGITEFLFLFIPVCAAASAAFLRYRRRT